MASDQSAGGTYREPLASEKGVYGNPRHLDGVSSLEYATLLASWRWSKDTDTQEGDS